LSYRFSGVDENESVAAKGRLRLAPKTVSCFDKLRTHCQLTSFSPIPIVGNADLIFAHWFGIICFTSRIPTSDENCVCGNIEDIWQDLQLSVHFAEVIVRTDSDNCFDVPRPAFVPI
jgi:hypothetical protein